MDIVLCAIIVAGGLYGYKKGVVALAIKPLNRIAGVGLSAIACMPLSEIIATKVTGGILNPLMLRAFSILASFFLVLILGGWILSLVAGIITSIFDIGILGMMNHTVGALAAIAISIVFVWLLAILGKWINPEFSGGPIYGLLVSINPFK